MKLNNSPIHKSGRASRLFILIFLPVLIYNLSLASNSCAEVSNFPADFKEFWNKRLSELKSVQAGFEQDKTVSKDKIIGRDVWFRGYGNVRLHGYLAEPSSIKPNQKLPAVLLLHGYSDYGRPFWAERYARMGFVAFAIDVRG